MRCVVALGVLVAALAACKSERALVGAATPAGGKLITLDAADDPEGDTGWWPQVAFDANDRAHIAWCDAHHGDVRYATEAASAPSGWDVRSLVSQGAVGKYIALDIDPAGRPGIAFYDQDKKYLRYAWQTAAGTWQDERVVWGHEAGMGGTLRFDASGTPHLFYYLAAGKLIHAMRTSAGEWKRDVLADAQAIYSARISAARRPDGLWVSYVDWRMKDAALYLGHLTDAGFEKTLIADRAGPGWRSALVFLGPEPWLVHSARLTEQTALTRRSTSGAWEPALLIPKGSSFAAAPWGDRLVVAYQDMGDVRRGGTVNYTVSDAAGTGWTARLIDSDGPVGGYIAAAVSKAGRLLVPYYADSARSLKLYDEVLR
ncbi:MAG TPA: hypothetical protein VFH51_14365 [Myxococcota bacterium]|nr:hypothetical protein [Myxococcota bacterium]